MTPEQKEFVLRCNLEQDLRFYANNPEKRRQVEKAAGHALIDIRIEELLARQAQNVKEQ